MPTTTVLVYISFIWFLLLHIFEEIAQGIWDTHVFGIALTRRKYLLGASAMTTANLGALALLIAGERTGLYLAAFVGTVAGVGQVFVHAVGYVKEGWKARRLGAGFYSSVPLVLAGGVVLYRAICELL